MNTNLWFYTDGRQTFGPMQSLQLIQMVRARQVVAEHLVAMEGSQDWLPVSASPFVLYLPSVGAAPVVVAAPQGKSQPRSAGAPAASGKKNTALRLAIGGIAVIAMAAAFFLWNATPVRKMSERLEGEKLKVAKVTGPAVEVQPMADFSAATWSQHSQLLWIRAKKEDSLSLVLPVREAGRQRIVANLTLAPNYSRIEVTLDGRPVQGSPFQLKHHSVTTTGLIDWGVHELTAGNHDLTFRFAEDAIPSRDLGCGFGLDFVQLEPPVLKPASVAPGTNIAPKAVASVSHCWGGDTVTALNDNVAPASGQSSDRSLLRHTFWARTGGFEWAQYDWDVPQCVNECSVFWYQDGGGIFMPFFWRVLYRDESGAWIPVRAETPVAQPDQWNTVKFPAVVTRSLRLSVQCAVAKSAGVLEWKVTAADPATVQPPGGVPPDLFLGEITPIEAEVGWHSYRVSQFHQADLSEGSMTKIAGKSAERYLWAHARSRIDFAIPPGYTRFTATGFGPVNERRGTRAHGQWRYQVSVDGRRIFESKALSEYPNLELPIDVALPRGSRRLTLEVDPMGDGNSDHAFWGNPTFSAGGAPLPDKLAGTTP